FAIDTELLGHWWAEGPIWLRDVLRGAEHDSVRLLTLSAALGEHEPEDRSARESSWGEGKSLETWDSPAVADMVWATRRSELRLLRAFAAGRLSETAATRAARELLALQSSDWAFMTTRALAADYPLRRSAAHSAELDAALAALTDSAPVPEPAVRSLAPDLDVEPLTGE
ncbi:MAG: DUF1957 domain-containing protein, partial [Thermoleophilaceae bacterium]|nr:DUF1957 domain-containing protein [Thermoleophilaceae bacterium]